ncbi:MAG: hypothetical protein J6C62_05205 [Clostridia bacterium]|nr:hypothetical protein [Clostridia bacterium]
MFKCTTKLWDILGEILAVVLVLTYALLIINANFQFIHNQTILMILDILRTYGSLALVGVVGLEAMSKRNFILQLIFLALCAIIVIFLFFPDTYTNLIGAIKK